MNSEKIPIVIKPKIMVNNYENSGISAIFARNFDKLKVYILCQKTSALIKA